jgi:hypothetical protein
MNYTGKEISEMAKRQTGAEFAHTPQGRESSQTKIERYIWPPIPDRPGELAWVNKRLLNVDDDYQRELSIIRTMTISRDFSWLAYGVLLVARRKDGTLWVYDGQHRWMAARNRADVQDVPCIIHDVDDIIAEARGFFVANVTSAAVSSWSKHRALVVAQEPVALQINALCARYGYIPSRDSKVARGVLCLARLRKVIQIDPDITEQTVATIADISGGSDEQLPEVVLAGLFTLARAVKGKEDIFSRTNVEKMKAKGLAGLKNAALGQADIERRSTAGRGGEAVWARGVMGVLNAYRRARKIRWPVGGMEDENGE